MFWIAAEYCCSLMSNVFSRKKSKLYINCLPLLSHWLPSHLHVLKFVCCFLSHSDLSIVIYFTSSWSYDHTYFTRSYILPLFFFFFQINIVFNLLLYLIIFSSSYSFLTFPTVLNVLGCQSSECSAGICIDRYKHIVLARSIEWTVLYLKCV